jgi:MoxR-like ATPase
MLRGRSQVLAQDVWSLAPDVLRHRIVLSYEALAENVTAEDLVDQVLRKIPIPQIGLPGETESPYKQEGILKANTDVMGVESKRSWWPRRRKKATA